jgi:cardiolipin synthase
VGSTNFDHRSFSINDEVNLASSDERMASELNAHFAEDVLRCEEVSYDQWVHRPIWERMHEGLGWILERQE